MYWGLGVGAAGDRAGEICFNTAMTGYQEILSDPSYAGQIVTFTFPHIGNTGANEEDIESTTPQAQGAILKAPVTAPSSFRHRLPFADWLAKNNLVAVCGIDTRHLTHRLRTEGTLKGVIAHDPEGAFAGALSLSSLHERAATCPDMVGLDLANAAGCRHPHAWEAPLWSLPAVAGDCTPAHDSQPQEEGKQGKKKSPHVVVVDYGVKHNILRSLTSRGCRVSVVPAQSSAEAILAHRPDGVVLSNGPGDPGAVGSGATIQSLIAAEIPIFGICLGHQMLARALGAHTEKMHHGHHGANHPIKNLATGQVEITSQNHEFVVSADSLPPGVEATHVSLFDGTLAGLKMTKGPVFSVQYHPEASPGPHDSGYLFDHFTRIIGGHA